MIGQMTRFAAIILFSTLVVSCAPRVSQVKTDDLPVNEIQNIRVTKGPEKTDVVVEGQQPMIYTTFHLTNPDRLIVDMAGISLGKFTEKMMVDEGPVQSILPKSGGANQVSRLEIELKEPSETNVRTEGTNLLVEVVKASEKNTGQAEKSQAENPQAALNEETKAILPLPVKEEAALPPAKNIKSIRFDRKNGLQLILTADGQLSPQIFHLDKSRLVIDLPNVKTSTKAKSIPAKDRAVKQVRVGQHTDKLRFVVDTAMPIVYSWEQQNHELKISLQDASHVAPSKTEGGGNSAVSAPDTSLAVPVVPPPVVVGSLVLEGNKEMPPSEEMAQTPTENPEKSEPISSDGSETDSPKLRPSQDAVAEQTDIILENGETSAPKRKKNKPDMAPSGLPKFAGRKISLDFQDAEIANVVRLIADVSSLNIVMGEDVKGKVTLKLVSVPWDQALDIILKMNNLGQIREGNIIRVATLTNIAKQQDEEAKAKESKIQAEDLITRILYINYGKAKDLSEPLKKTLSPRGDITTDERTNSMLVKDIAKNVNDIEALVRRLDTQTPQVVIEARIVQVAPTFNRSLGIKWGADFQNTSNGNIIGISNATPVSPFGTPSPDFAVNLPAASNFGGVGFTFGRFTGNPFNLDLRISAGESQGLTRIISTPKVSVLDNQEAKIEQGESIPFSTVSQQGTQTTFVDANLTLLVTPRISPDGGIIMKVKVSKNAAGETRPGAAGPSILKKEATTQILVMDGETTVIGGIYETSKTDSISGIPFLMDIPVLGWLFKTTTRREDTSELLVFLTPRILK